MARTPKNPVDLPAKEYFAPDELLALIEKSGMYVRMNESERQKYYRNTDKDRAKAALYLERIEFWRRIRDKLVELGSVVSSN